MSKTFGGRYFDKELQRIKREAQEGIASEKPAELVSQKQWESIGGFMRSQADALDVLTVENERMRTEIVGLKARLDATFDAEATLKIVQRNYQSACQYSDEKQREIDALLAQNGLLETSLAQIRRGIGDGYGTNMLAAINNLHGEIADLQSGQKATMWTVTAYSDACEEIPDLDEREASLAEQIKDLLRSDKEKSQLWQELYVKPLRIELELLQAEHKKLTEIEKGVAATLRDCLAERNRLARYVEEKDALIDNLKEEFGALRDKAEGFDGGLEAAAIIADQTVRHLGSQLTAALLALKTPYLECRNHHGTLDEVSK